MLWPQLTLGGMLSTNWPQLTSCPSGGPENTAERHFSHLFCGHAWDPSKQQRKKDNSGGRVCASICVRMCLCVWYAVCMWCVRTLCVYDLYAVYRVCVYGVYEGTYSISVWEVCMERVCLRVYGVHV